MRARAHTHTHTHTHTPTPRTHQIQGGVDKAARSAVGKKDALEKGEKGPNVAERSRLSVRSGANSL